MTPTLPCSVGLNAEALETFLLDCILLGVFFLLDRARSSFLIHFFLLFTLVVLHLKILIPYFLEHLFSVSLVLFFYDLRFSHYSCTRFVFTSFSMTYTLGKRRPGFVPYLSNNNKQEKGHAEYLRLRLGNLWHSSVSQLPVLLSLQAGKHNFRPYYWLVCRGFAFSEQTIRGLGQH